MSNGLVGRYIPGSDEDKAQIAEHKKRNEKLGEDLVAALNAYTKEHGHDFPVNTDPVDKAKLAAALAADTE